MSAFVWTDERNQKDSGIDLCKFLETLLMFHRYGFFFLVDTFVPERCPSDGGRPDVTADDDCLSKAVI